ncbi:MAG: divergent polysaccharide deacetylase family protein [Candidatus Hydrogenedentes bacterium]|nr:divergent polysaccharide deacetylase family protein [Candidatus Hydrogenedentota bacterium]
MADQISETILEESPDVGATESSGNSVWLYLSVLSVIIPLGLLGSYLLVAFLKSRPVDLVQLTEANETRISAVLPSLGKVRQISHEDSADRYASWRTYMIELDLFPEITVETALNLIVKALNNTDLIIKAAHDTDGRDLVTVSYLGYETHRIKLFQINSTERNTTVFEDVKEKPKAAIIVDDLGYSSRGIDDWLAIPAPLSFAVLPQLPLSSKLATAVHDKGREVLLHLPLEGSPGSPVTAGTLLTSMTDTDMRAALQKNIESVPGAIGINNHQGSVFTSDYDAMTRLMRMVAKTKLFFVDSQTSLSSVAEKVAHEQNVPFAANSLFLDNIDQEEYIEGQITKLMGIAREKGVAIGICHVTKTSSREVLSRSLPLFDAQGIELVPVSALVH